jgi:hypothetical protein
MSAPEFRHGDLLERAINSTVNDVTAIPSRNKAALDAQPRYSAAANPLPAFRLRQSISMSVDITSPNVR